MLRSILTLFAASLAAPVLAQAPVASGQTTDCLVRVNPAPASWIIQGYDPFASSIPEGTYGVTFVNDGGAECRFRPTFVLRQPPFGLSKGTEKPVRYALLNLTDTQDVTPRAGRSQPRLSQREIVLAPGESRSLTFRLVAEPNDVRSSGTFTQDVTLEAQDSNFRSLGGAPLVFGINVLPSARVGLTGAYRRNDGQAVVDLGELKEGVAPVPLQLRVSSTGDYDIVVSSANSGQLRLGSSQWFIPYSVAIGGNTVNLAGASTVTGSKRSGLLKDSLPFQFVIGDVSNRRAGVYSDVISVSITAR
ncbi:hypothetical protein [Sphingorhabdus sp. EL138]|uniref:hypothetical protein n=1 Tax=Sphingorhabdus sp. EL138 TaxID=2073156 RepID=UPI0020B114F2|nr:hypothetical protein [Sphingorhabdus sp. EL138]